ncbi:hypothetical protein SeMB42_g05193 [Synchytrium endobioticum]|uniref:EF-hand domain-containing protein n=1 Tax=Synchytrium endobioticum TaxID=286115 RepID=A0A507CMM4_9FUNG|nr:hypothetical protein SeLEV6574_g06819 [Synchytrium endobioticum]TPX42279.1 hypothetical protein SeMB42_g05193 [Synchytrium endobioticum]
MRNRTVCNTYMMHQSPARRIPSFVDSNATSINISQVAQVNEIFKRVDIDRKGFLSRSEFKIALVGLLSYIPSKFEIDQMLASLRFTDDDVKVTCTDLISLISARLSIPETDMIRQTFSSFDLNCNGFITPQEMKKLCSHYATFIPETVIERAFAVADEDGDGRLSYREFVSLMSRANAIWKSEEGASKVKGSNFG